MPNRVGLGQPKQSQVAGLRLKESLPVLKSYHRGYNHVWHLEIKCVHHSIIERMLHCCAAIECFILGKYGFYSHGKRRVEHFILDVPRRSAAMVFEHFWKCLQMISMR